MDAYWMGMAFLRLQSDWPHPLSMRADPITNQRVPAECQAARAEAWHHVHPMLAGALQWDGKEKEYKLEMEEEEAAGEAGGQATAAEQEGAMIYMVIYKYV